MNTNRLALLSMMLVASSPVLESCSSKPENTDDGGYDSEDQYTAGVAMQIKETEKGKFVITDETQVARDSSAAYVTYLNGKTEKLSPEAAKALIDNDIKQHPQHIGHNNGLGNVLLHGAMGYMLARTFSPGYRSYRPEFQQENRSGMSAPYDATSRFYASTATQNKSTAVLRNLDNTRIRASRPIGSRSGFFGRSGRGSFGS